MVTNEKVKQHLHCKPAGGTTKRHLHNETQFGPFACAEAIPPINHRNVTFPRLTRLSFGHILRKQVERACACGRVRTGRPHRHGHVNTPGAAQLPPTAAPPPLSIPSAPMAMIRPRQVWPSLEKPLAKVKLLQAMPR